jgi:hypothetical protein
MKRKRLIEEVTITGYVRAADWDWQDDISGISIETHDDEEYVIDPNGLDDLLFYEVDREVELTGTVEQDDDGTKCITVTSYKSLSEPDMEEEEDYGFEENYDFEEDYGFEEDSDPEFDQESFPIHMPESDEKMSDECGPL